MLQIRRRRLGGRAAGGAGSRKLFWVSQGDDVDVASAQYFVNLAPVLLFRRRFKSVAVRMDSLRVGGTPSFVGGRVCVCDPGPCGPWAPSSPGFTAFHLLCVVLQMDF